MKNLPISEQLIATIIGVVVVFLVELIPALEPLRDSLTEIIAVLVAYILGKSGLEMVRAKEDS